MVIREWSRLTAPQREIIERHQASVPIKLSALARDLGLRVVASTLPSGISGEIRPVLDGYQISVNRHDSTRRQRFTVAHEISHFLLHRDQIGDGITDDVLYRSSLSDSREAEANRLAADIILPREALAARLAETPLAGDELVAALAAEFQVSEVAMKIRLGLT